MQIRQNLTKLDKYLFYFIVIDVFFAPYFPLLAIATSQFFVFGWFLLRGSKCCNPKEVKAYYFFLLFIVLSNMVSLFVIPPEQFDKIFIDNWKRGINIGTSVSYYFFFSYYFRNSNTKAWKWVFLLVVYMALWAMLYYADLGSFFHYKTIFNPRDSTMLSQGSRDISFRFNFIWTDPNNVGYAIVGLVTALIINRSTPNLLMVISIMLSVFVMLMTMSMGTLISGCIFIPVSLLFRLKNDKSLLNIISMIFFCMIAVYMVNYMSADIMESDSAKTSLARLEKKEETGDDRPKIWRTLLESKSVATHAIIGEGSNIFVEKQVYSPHSGHLMLIFSYGLIAYLLFMYIIFRKPHVQTISAYIPTLPFLFGFTSNIGIGEIKFVGVLAFVVASMRTRMPMKTKR